jgi:hypothetical protein
MHITQLSTDQEHFAPNRITGKNLALIKNLIKSFTLTLEGVRGGAVG